MKKTFEKGMYVPDAKTRELKQVMLDYAKQKGVPVSNFSNLDAEYDHFYFIIFFNDYCCLNTYSDGNKRNNSTPITIAQFFEYCDNWKECQVDQAWIPVSVKPEDISTDYNVRIDNGVTIFSACGGYDQKGFFMYGTSGKIHNVSITHYSKLLEA